MDIRGLTLFISDVRKCGDQEKENQRVNKELAKIRQYFTKSKLQGYDRKKCVAKLLYVYMLGYDIDFGHIEAINLLASRKYSEKHLGYLACSILLNENHEMLTLITQRFRADLLCNIPMVQSLALTCIANIGGKETAESLIHDVQKVLTGAQTDPLVRKKSALTLLRLYRKYPELLPPGPWSRQVINLLSSSDLGVITALMSLLLALVSKNRDEYKGCVSRSIRLLVSIVINRQYSSKYLYYGIPAPWLQIKLLRILQYYPIPTDEAVLQNITSVMNTNIDKAQRIRKLENNKNNNPNRYNALHAVFFETLNLAIHYDNDKQMLIEGGNILLKYVDSNEANLRYLALDTLSRLAYSQFKDVVAVLRRKQQNILLCLKDGDISLRRRALDVLYSMCSKENADRIVGELLEYLPLSDYNIREELVLKVAILAEKFASDFSWYIDVVLSLIRESGDFVGEDIWYRICQIVTNRGDEKLQKYTCETVFHAVSSPSAHEVCVKVAGYILGEFGDLVIDNELMTPMKQFKLLLSKFEICGVSCKVILLNAFMKMYNLYPEDEYTSLRTKIKNLFEVYKSNFNIEIQQRCVEYWNAIEKGDPEVIERLMEEMPPFSTKRSVVEMKLLEKEKDVTNKGLRGKKSDKEGEEGEEMDIPDQDESESDDEEEEEEEEEEQDDLIPGLGDTGKPKDEPKEVGIADILGLGGNESSVKTPTTPQMTNKLSGFFGGETSATANDNPFATSGSQEGEFFQDEESERMYNDLLISKLGYLFEATFLRLKVKQEYKESKGRVGLYYENKASNKVDLSVSVEEIDGLRMEYTNVSGVDGNSQASQYFKLSCKKAFEEPPKLTVNYSTSLSQGKKVIRLPFGVNKFVDGFDVDGKEEFFGIWGSIEKGEPQMIVSTFRTEPNGYNVSKLKELLKTGFGIQTYSGIVDETSNVVGGGVFKCEEGKDQVLIRIQVNPGKRAIRLTTKSNNGEFNRIFSKLLKEQIERL